MKKYFPYFVGLVLLLSACTENCGTLIGSWVVDKVNVQFDENRSTPELVKQVGEMEKGNSIVISADSVLIFKSLEGERRGRLSLSDGRTLLVDGILFGQWKDGEIVTTEVSPLGEIVVRYRKK